MDVRLSEEQTALRDSAAAVVDSLGPRTVADLEDAGRTAQLDRAATESGWRELRAPTEDGGPLASAVEVAVVAEELGRGLADTAFVGPTLAAELRRLGGAPACEGYETVVLSADLSELARAPGGVVAAGSVVPDAAGARRALVLLPSADGDVVAALTLSGVGPGVDLTRSLGSWQGTGQVTTVPGVAGALGPDDRTRVHALGLALSSADLVGTMRGAITLATGYARDRRQYGAPIGSFQAVQHLLADAFVEMEGSHSITLHAAWAVDALAPAEALRAASAAKAYCARAARSVCETAIQVHGGIGNTWECLAHVFLRRALVSGQLLGGVGENLDRVMAAHGVVAGPRGGAGGLR